jgi:hypothetical protein
VQVINANGRANAGTHPDDYRLAEPNPLLEQATDLDENEAARVHLEGAEPADLLDDGATAWGTDPETMARCPMHCNHTQSRPLCKANWPARRQPTEGEWATLERAATRGLEGGHLCLTFLGSHQGMGLDVACPLWGIRANVVAC